MAERNTERLVVLDGLRGLAALTVVVHHCTQRGAMPLFGGAGLAVDLFFCLSGYVIAVAYLQRLDAGMGFLSFMQWRVRRLYPLYLVGMGLGIAALVLKTASHTSTMGWAEVAIASLANLLYLPYLSSHTLMFWDQPIANVLFPTNNPAWSLFFELLINAVFALPWLIQRRWSYPLLAVLAMAGLAVWMKLSWISTPGWGQDNALGGIPRVTYGFMMGVCIALAQQRWPGALRLRRWLPAWPLLLATAVGLAITVKPLTWLLLCVVGVPLVVALGVLAQPTGPMLSRILSSLGWLSYPLYCVHYPVYALVSCVWQPTGPHPELMALALSLPLSIGVAIVAARLTHEPFPR